MRAPVLMWVRGSPQAARLSQEGGLFLPGLPPGNPRRVWGPHGCLCSQRWTHMYLCVHTCDLCLG